MFYLTKLLVKLFVKDSDNCDNPKVRTAYGNLSGVCGIILNLLLFGGKLFAGIVSASVSVIADALNNLSDAGSSVVTFLGFKLASRPADREHPFGHGRYEYVAGLGISVVILLMGVELIKSSIEKIITPEDKTAFSTLSLAIMIASIFVKFWMYFLIRDCRENKFNRTQGGGTRFVDRLHCNLGCNNRIAYFCLNRSSD